MRIDSLTHLTPDGRWFSSTHDASEDALLRQMDETGTERAAVVGLAGHIPNDFVLDVCTRRSDRFLPVGSFNPAAYAGEAEVAAAARDELRGRGFTGVKLHPRLGGYSPLDPRVFALLDEMAGWSRPPAVWLCTYFHFAGGRLERSPVEIIHEMVGRYPGLPFVLLHGTGPDILRLAHAVRANANAYLDLSYTAPRYAGSSVELDLRYLLNTFEQRLLFGSDFPEITLPEARACFDRLCAGAKPGAREAVEGSNLARALGLAAG